MVPKVRQQGDQHHQVAFYLAAVESRARDVARIEHFICRSLTVQSGNYSQWFGCGIGLSQMKLGCMTAIFGTHFNDRDSELSG